jgi:hypothetical protein
MRDIFLRKGDRPMMSTVIGGAMLPHAPQFFTMPETEDKAVVAHMCEVAADIRPQAARALAPFLAQLQIERLRPKSAKQSAKQDR